MTQKVFLHVGLPKTATTFFQIEFFPKLDSSKFSYNPPSITEKLKQIYQSGDIDDCTILQINELINRETLSGKKTLIISDEHLGYWGWNPSSGKGAFLAGKIFKDAEILISLRYQVDWLLSLYKHAVDCGCVVDIKKFLNYLQGSFCDSEGEKSESVNGPMNVYNANWAKYISSFTNIFGVNRVHILFYENFLRERETFIKRLCDIIGSDYFELRFERTHNRSPSAFTCLLSRYYARFSRTFHINNRSSSAWNQRIANDGLGSWIEARRHSLVPVKFILKKIIFYLRFATFLAVMRKFDQLIYLDWDLLAQDGLRKKLHAIYHNMNNQLLEFVPREEIPDCYFTDR